MLSKKKNGIKMLNKIVCIWDSIQLKMNKKWVDKWLITKKKMIKKIKWKIKLIYGFMSE